MKLDEIARRIDSHLRRFADDPAIARPDGRVTKYWFPNARHAGARVMIKYISYQFEHSLTKQEAWRYLAWLDAGNVGRHFAVPE